MIITRLKLTNWRNFTDVDVPMRDRAFIIGPNASGKSNLLDAIRFLRDVAKREGGGLQAAVRRRGGVRQIRSLSAHSSGGVGIEVHLSHDADEPVEWVYRLVFNGEDSGDNRIVVEQETVESNGETLLQRPNEDDANDPELLTETALEQTNANRKFRPVAEFFDEVVYLHLVPQLVRYGAEIGGNRLENDPLGQGFLERIAATDEKTRQIRLDKIATSLSLIVPQLEDIAFERDQITGQPHLRARFGHWRDNDAWQREDKFSDGTLRLIGLFWTLLERSKLGGTLLLEEPEISLHRDIKLRLAALIYRLSLPDWKDWYLQAGKPTDNLKERRQVILTTHSPSLLEDQGIDGWEVFYIATGDNGSVVKPLAAHRGMRKMLEGGGTAGFIAPFRNQSSMIPPGMGFQL